MTVMEQRGAYKPAPPPAWQPRTDPAPLLPDTEPHRVLGTEAAAKADPALLRTLYTQLVRGRRYNAQATALTKQGRLAVYPSSTGQEACEVAAALALKEQDWLFPSYRDTLAVVARGVDPVEALTLLRGDWHTGYDPYEHRVAPSAPPSPRSSRTPSVSRTPPASRATTSSRSPWSATAAPARATSTRR
ncbi:hypothetical protein GCM10020256_36580 [Streptomyces thermocoprophilus]